jgi:hypothetical protein
MDEGQQRRGHEGGDQCHQNQHREKRGRNDFAIKSNIQKHKLNQAPGIYQHAHLEAFVLRESFEAERDRTAEQLSRNSHYHNTPAPKPELHASRNRNAGTQTGQGEEQW